MVRSYIHDGGPAQGNVLIPASEARENALNAAAVAEDRVEDYRERTIAAYAAIAFALLDVADAIRAAGTEEG